MIIHYCWFGNNEKNEIVLRCIESWHRFCPDAEFIEWNESNFDINICKYVREAYENKKWSFVSDYCRYFALYNFGGIYLDTDVELIKRLDDLPETFVGFEIGNGAVASGLIRGAKKGDLICKSMCELYEHDEFNKDSGLNLETVCQRETKIFIQHGLDIKKKGTIQVVGETFIYPEEYFCPFDYLTGKLFLTSNTYSIHHYLSSWVTKKDKEIIQLTRRLSSLLPRSAAHYIAIFIKTVEHEGLLTTIKKIRNKVRNCWATK